MKKILLIAVFISACSTFTSRSPQSTIESLNEDFLTIKKDAEANRITSNTCKTYFAQTLQNLKEERLHNLTNPSNSDLITLQESNWQAFVALHSRMDSFINCRSELRSVFFKLRSFRDMVGDKQYGSKPFTGAEIDFKSQPIPLKENEFYKGYLSKDGTITNRPISFESGDLMLTRGTSFFSAVLGAISKQQGQFSHFVLVHKSSTGVEQTMEAYAQSGGVTRFTMEDALKNENSRILLIRPKDSALAAKAAQGMLDNIIAEETGQKPRARYDYQMSLDTKDRMTCSEVSYWAYHNASDGKFILPQEKSVLSPELKQIYRKTGISSVPMLTPQDMDVDTRFNVIAEFTDYRLARDNRYREAVMLSLLNWIKSEKYWIQISNKSIAIDALVYPLRRTKLWPAFRKLTNVPDFPADMPKGFLKTLTQLNAISDILYKRLSTEDQKFAAATGWSLTPEQMASVLEQYRKEDLEKYVSGGRSDFHLLFRPLGVSPKVNY